MNPIELLQDLIRMPGPSGAETQVAEYVESKVRAIGYEPTRDAKGNVRVALKATDRPKIVVTAHMDEIGMMVREIRPDGRLKIVNVGGLYPWKIGEGAVQILGDRETLDGVMGFGAIHTADPSSTVRQGDNGPVNWSHVHVFTGLTDHELKEHGVRPGTRVAIHPSRRGLVKLGEHVAGPFLDDRADVVAWLLALEMLKGSEADALFVATTSEEVGGEGALYTLRDARPELCIALELGPTVADAPVELTSQPTVWTKDSYGSMSQADGAMLAKLGAELGMELQFQSLSRGGSDASIAAGMGLCARPITLGLPMENTHGFEIMHRDAMDRLAGLTAELVRRESR